MIDINPYEWEQKHRTEAGGFTQSSLAEIGVEWPPEKGWIKGWKRRWDNSQPPEGRTLKLMIDINP